MPRRNNFGRIIRQYLKGAQLQRPFCVWGAIGVALLLWAAPGNAAPLCPADRVDERAVVSKVIDGDTVALADGRHVRFVGINTPEVGHDDKPAEPLGDEARHALEALLKTEQAVFLRYDEERLDTYRRTLAHLYLSDKSSVEAALVAEGLAFAISIPPNLHDSACYRAQEQVARAAKRGVWSQEYFEPLQARQVAAGSEGFRRVAGRIERVGQSKNSVWLNLAPRMALRVAREDLKFFTTYNPESLRGKTLVARGWITQYKNGDYVMRVRHPDALEIVN